MVNRDGIAVRPRDFNKGYDAHSLNSLPRGTGNEQGIGEAALGDLRELLGELEVLAGSSEPDVGKVHRTLTNLRARFDDLTSRTQTFLASLQRTIDLQGIGVDSFLAYKDRLIEDLERFIGELIIMTREIAGQLRRIEVSGIDRLLGF